MKLSTTCEAIYLSPVPTTNSLLMQLMAASLYKVNSLPSYSFIFLGKYSAADSISPESDIHLTSAGGLCDQKESLRGTKPFLWCKPRLMGPRDEKLRPGDLGPILAPLLLTNGLLWRRRWSSSNMRLTPVEIIACSSAKSEADKLYLCSQHEEVIDKQRGVDTDCHRLGIWVQILHSTQCYTIGHSQYNSFHKCQKTPSLTGNDALMECLSEKWSSYEQFVPKNDSQNLWSSVVFTIYHPRVFRAFITLAAPFSDWSVASSL
jgi:hypothetical protein